LSLHYIRKVFFPIWKFLHFKKRQHRRLMYGYNFRHEKR